MAKTPNPGARVAHTTLDADDGGAKAGVVEEYVGDEDTGVVIIRNPDGTSEGYDRREVVPLHGLQLFSGPVLLHPRHFLAMLKRPTGMLGLLLAVVVGFALNVFAIREDWDEATVVAIGVALTAITVWLVLAAQRSRRENASQSR